MTRITTGLLAMFLLLVAAEANGLGPEPATLFLFGTGLAAAAAGLRKPNR